MEITRRQLCSFLPAIIPGFLMAQDSGLASGTFAFDELPTKKTDFAEMRSIMKGTTRTGEQVEVHETTLHPGESPHPPHRHKNSEFWLIREGTVEITINGQKRKLGPGSAGFAASNDEHGIRNVGDVPATYFVVAIGPTS